MSLINQMLRDLESRRAAERRQQSGGIFSGLTSGTTMTAHPRWLTLLASGVIGLLLILVAYLAWQRFVKPPTPIAAVQTPGNVVSAQVAPTAVAPGATPVTPEPIQAPAQVPVEPGSTSPQAVSSTPAPAATVSVVAPAPDKASTKKPHTQETEPEPAAESAFIEKTPRPLSLTQQADKAYQQGIAYLREGKSAAAESSLRDALRLDQEHLQARETLSAMLLGAGRIVEASQILEAGRRFFSRNPTLALLMSRIQVEQGDLSNAIITLEQNLTAGATRSDYLAFLAALYQRALRYNDSITAYQQALGLEPAQGSSWAGLAISLENAGRANDALKAYQQAAANTLPPQLVRYVQSRLQALAHD